MIHNPKCKCGHSIQINTLQAELHNLIEKHTLPEILDRLSDMVHLQKHLEDESFPQQAWNGVEIHLEKAVEAALEVATLKAEKGLPQWR